MQERNKYLEKDGLYFESDTHEWFNDKSVTDYAHKQWATVGKSETIKLLCFVVRDKKTGSYAWVLVDEETTSPIYTSCSLEDTHCYIDKLSTRFKTKPYN